MIRINFGQIQTFDKNAPEPIQKLLTRISNLGLNSIIYYISLYIN